MATMLRPRLTGYALSIDMKEMGEANKGDLKNDFTGGAVLYVVLLPAIVGAL